MNDNNLAMRDILGVLKFYKIPYQYRVSVRAGAELMFSMGANDVMQGAVIPRAKQALKDLGYEVVETHDAIKEIVTVRATKSWH